MNTQDNFFASKVSYTPKQEDLILNIFDQFNKMVDIVNIKAIGVYTDTIFPSAEKWYLNADVKAQGVLYVTVDCGTLPNTGVVNVAHNIPITTGYRIIEFYGTATDPVGFLTRSMLGDPNISILINQTNIVITTTANLSAYTQSHLVIKYVTI
jgi:hypothetical protein